MSGVCVVAGGVRGIGAATALRAAQAGYAVGVGYHQHPQRAAEVVDQIRGRGGTAAALAGDVAREADVVAMFDRPNATWDRCARWSTAPASTITAGSTASVPTTSPGCWPSTSRG